MVGRVLRTATTVGRDRESQAGWNRGVNWYMVMVARFAPYLEGEICTVLGVFCRATPHAPPHIVSQTRLCVCVYHMHEPILNTSHAGVGYNMFASTARVLSAIKQKVSPEEDIPVSVVGAKCFCSSGLHDHVSLHVGRGSEVGCLWPFQRPRVTARRRLCRFRCLTRGCWLVSLIHWFIGENFGINDLDHLSLMNRVGNEVTQVGKRKKR